MPANHSEKIEVTLNVLRRLYDQKQLVHKHVQKTPQVGN